MNIAVIGSGVMGQNHLRNFAQMEGVEIVAICDIDQKLGRKIAKLYKTKFYPDHRELLKREDVNAVTIAVPTKFHHSVCMDFIKAKIPTLVEKPLALNTRQAAELVKYAREKDIVFTVGHTERFNPAILKLEELVSSGAFGDILSIVVKRVGLFVPRVKDIGVVVDLAVHDLDIICAISRKVPEAVFARGGNTFTKKQEDHAEIFLDYGNFGCFMQVNWVTPVKIRSLAITGSRGYAELNYITQKLEFYKTKFEEIGETKNFKDFVSKFGEPQKINVLIEKGEPLRLELENFLNAACGVEKLKVSPEEALRAIMLSEKVLESIKKGKLIKI